MFGCIVGKFAEKSIDYADDDILALDRYLNKVLDKVWSNKMTMRVITVFLLVIANIQLIHSQAVDEYVSMIPVWTPM